MALITSWSKVQSTPTTTKYYGDYPTVRIGGGNPYRECASCGRSAPEINGRLEGHLHYCEYRIEKETNG